MNTRKASTLSLIAMAGLALVTAPAQAATIFVTNDNGNASELDGDNAGTVTPLTLSAVDGGGILNVTSIEVMNGSSNQSLGMTDISMGVGNEKWGNTRQRWSFSFDQDVSFDALGFGGNRQGMKFESVAWKDDAAASASNWNFTSNGTVGTFTFFSNDGPAFDFTAAGISNVAAGTPMKIEHVSGAGGARMLSFTVTPIPPSNPIPSPTAAFAGLIGLAGLGMRRRRGQ